MSFYPTPPVSATLPKYEEQGRRYRGLVVPIGEYQVFSEDWKEKKQYHLMVNAFQHSRIQEVQRSLFSEFCPASKGKFLQFQNIDPKPFGVITESSDWFMYTNVKIGDTPLLPSSGNNLYLRCIYWENDEYLHKQGVSIVGLKSLDRNLTSVSAPALENRNLVAI